MRVEPQFPAPLFAEGLLDALLREALGASGFQMSHTNDIRAGAR